MSDASLLPYRPCVGIMLLNARYEVFVGQRIDSTAEAWQMPQGGIDPGEEAEAAARRELCEETGVTKASLIARFDIELTYDLPEALIPKLWGGKYRGQSQIWFAFRLESDDSHIDIETEQPEFKAWQWVEMQKLPEMIVPFKRDLYQKLVDEFSPLFMP